MVQSRTHEVYTRPFVHDPFLQSQPSDALLLFPVRSIRSRQSRSERAEARAHRSFFMCALFLFDLTIKLGEPPALFSARRKLLASLGNCELDVLPCSWVHCASQCEWYDMV